VTGAVKVALQDPVPAAFRVMTHNVFSCASTIFTVPDGSALPDVPMTGTGTTEALKTTGELTAFVVGTVNPVTVLDCITSTVEVFVDELKLLSPL